MSSSADGPTMATLLVVVASPPRPSTCRGAPPISADSTASRESPNAVRSSRNRYKPLDVPPRNCIAGNDTSISKSVPRNSPCVGLPAKLRSDGDEVALVRTTRATTENHLVRIVLSGLAPSSARLLTRALDGWVQQACARRISRLLGDLGHAAQLVDVGTRRNQVHLVGADVLEPAQHVEQLLVGAGPSGGGRHGV